MLMHNLRDNCNDIDIRVTKEIFQDLLIKYNIKDKKELGFIKMACQIHMYYSVKLLVLGMQRPMLI